MAEHDGHAHLSGSFLRRFRDLGSKKFHNLTATQFMEVWEHFDQDGNGFIEGKELDRFLLELITSGHSLAKDAKPEAVTDEVLAELRGVIMEAYDENRDNKLEITELAQILQTEENFLLIFRNDNPLDSSVEFMKIWRQFDKDHSGFIESDELKDFLRSVLGKRDVSEEKLSEYTSSVLQLFDRNKDGKLQLSEMAKLLRVKENILSRPMFKGECALTKSDINSAFDIYDRDNNGFIEQDELMGFLKDLMELSKKDYNSDDLGSLEKILLQQWDVNHDGKISRPELTMLLMAHADY